MRDFQFVIGTRIHGNMIAIHAGVPALLLAHDTRTLEMARLLKLPHLRIDDPRFAEETSWLRRLLHWGGGGGEPRIIVKIRRLFEEADYAPMSAAYAALYARYRAFLERAGVAHNLE